MPWAHGDNALSLGTKMSQIAMIEVCQNTVGAYKHDYVDAFWKTVCSDKKCSVGDLLWHRGTKYSSHDSPGGPFMEGTIHGMTGHPLRKGLACETS